MASEPCPHFKHKPNAYTHKEVRVCLHFDDSCCLTVERMKQTQAQCFGFTIMLFLELLLLLLLLGVNCDHHHDDNDSDLKSEYGEIRQLSTNGDNNTSQFVWSINNFWDLVEEDSEMILSSRFFVSRPGYRLQLMLIPNTTYSDNTGYVGIFFRVVTGKYDHLIEWPYKLKTVLGLLTQNTIDSNANAEDFNFTVIPNTDPCRLRSAFLRPSADNDNNPRPDGCGNRRHLSLDYLHTNRDIYVRNGTLLVKITVYLFSFGEDYKKASVEMKYNYLVSNYEWVINDYPKAQNESLEKKNIVVLTSDPFYTHTKGYLMQMFMTLLPNKNAFAVSIALAQGDNDRYLQWPFPYTFDVAIVDQSPGYWKRDYSVTIHPPTSECGTEPFFQPANFPDFCFVTVQSMELLSLTHYNFIVNGTLRIRFTTNFERYTARQHASLVMHSRGLVSEYNWLVPAIDSKIEKYNYSEGKPKILASEQFYTNGQGYLLQMILTVNTSADNGNALGLELAIIEGEFDGVLDWPFNNTYELSIVRQSAEQNIFGESQLAENASNNKEDISVLVVPSDSGCGRQSFQKPIERNPACGDKSLISFDRISRSQHYIKTGNLRLRARVFQDND